MRDARTCIGQLVERGCESLVGVWICLERGNRRDSGTVAKPSPKRTPLSPRPRRIVRRSQSRRCRRTARRAWPPLRGERPLAPDRRRAQRQQLPARRPFGAWPRIARTPSTAANTHLAGGFRRSLLPPVTQARSNSTGERGRVRGTAGHASQRRSTRSCRLRASRGCCRSSSPAVSGADHRRQSWLSEWSRRARSTCDPLHSVTLAGLQWSEQRPNDEMNVAQLVSARSQTCAAETHAAVAVRSIGGRPD